MMNLQYAEQAYRSAMVNTSLSGLELIIHLYDGAIDFLEKASKAIADNNKKAKCDYIRRATAIIDELLLSLNHDVGGEISTNLESLYLYMLQELTLANASSDECRIRHVIELLKILRSAWSEIK